MTRQGRWKNGSAMATIIAAALLVGVQTVLANPTGPSVAAGGATITASPSTLRVDQNTKVVIINWQSFNIGAGETTRFVQPDAGSLAVNRIGGADPARILGNLTANGRVILIDGNGIVFGPNARVDVGALIATTHDAVDGDLLSGRAKFDKPGNGGIINNGRITANSGMVGLMASSVTNNGIVTARLGQVVLGAAKVFTLDFTGDGLISFAVDPAATGAAIDAGGKPVKAVVVNNGRIEGATVLLSARAAADLVTSVVSVKGEIVATAAHGQAGKIVLDAGEGSVDLAGARLEAKGGTIAIGGWSAASARIDSASVLDASAAENGGTISVISKNTTFHGTVLAGSQSGAGGSVETSGDRLDVSGARVDTVAPNGRTGEWLLDPADLLVDAAAAATISGSASNVTLKTTASSTTGPGTKRAAGSGDIYLLAPIAWSNGNTLTIDAFHSIFIDATLTVTNNGALVLKNSSGTNNGGYRFGIDSDGNAASIRMLSGSLNADGNAYTLVRTKSDLAAMSGSSGKFALADNIDASSWGTFTAAPITTFSGNFFGLGNTISNLTINAPALNNIGLIGTLSSTGTVRKLGVASGSITGKSSVGGLVGLVNGGTVNDAWSGASVVATSGAVSALGGLVGTLTGNGTVTNSYAAGSVTGASSTTAVGGLIGSLAWGSVSDSYATGNVVGGAQIGGLIGSAQPAGSNRVSIADSYATGAVSGTDRVGGLVGMIAGNATIATSYANGALTAPAGARLGGIAGDSAAVGSFSPTFTSAVFDSSRTGTTTGVGAHAGAPGVMALTTAQIQTQSSFAGWSIDAQGGTNAIWRLYPGQSPVLRHMLTPAYYVGGAVKTYDRRPFLVTGPVSAGIYALNTLASWQQGYDLIFGAGDKLTVNPAPIVAAMTGTVTKIYDATTAAVLSATNYVFSGVLAGDAVQFNGPLAGSYDTKNVGSGKTVTVAGAALSGADAHNYALTSTTISGAIGAITQATVSAALSGEVSKTYDTTAAATLTPSNYTFSGVLGSDMVSLAAAAGGYDNSNAGAGKTVTFTGLTLTGVDAADYALSTGSLSAAIGTITPAALTASLTGAVSKIYDATTTAALTPANYTLGGVLGGDVVALNDPSTGRFLTKDVGSNKSVEVSGLSLSGADAGNYLLSETNVSGAIGTITPAPVIALLAGTVSKIYDATTSAALSTANYSLSGVLGSDAVTLNASAAGTFDNRNAGTGKSIAVTGVTLTGADAGNYSLTSSAVLGAIGTITPAPLIITASADSKIYDSTASSAALPIVAGLKGSDAVTGLAESFGDKNAGTNKHLTVTAYTIQDGNGGANYAVSTVNGSGTITPALVTALLTGGVFKVYDGTVAAVLSLANYALSGLQAGDAVVLAAATTGTFDTPHAGTGKIVTVTGLTLAGADAANYNFGPTLSGSIGTISPAPLVLTVDNAARPVGQANPPLTYRLEGLVGGDASVVLSGVVLAANANSQSPAGSYGIVSSGGIAENYVIAQRVDGTLVVTQASSDVPGLRNSLTGDSRSDGTGEGHRASSVSVLTTTDAGVGFTAAIGEVICLVSNETVNRDRCSSADRGKSAPLSDILRTDRSYRDTAVQRTTAHTP